MTLQERLRDPAHGFDRNESHTEDRYVCLCEHLANEAADALDAKDARIRELEGALRGMIDLAEYWINREDRREMSKAQYDLWLAVGHHSKAMNRARAALKEPT